MASLAEEAARIRAKEAEEAERLAYARSYAEQETEKRLLLRDEMIARIQQAAMQPVPPHPFPREARLAGQGKRVAPPMFDERGVLLPDARPLSMSYLYAPKTVRTQKDWELANQRSGLLRGLQAVAGEIKDSDAATKQAFQDAITLPDGTTVPMTMIRNADTEIKPHRQEMLPSWSPLGKAFNWMSSIGGTFGGAGQLVGGRVLNALGLPNYAYDNRQEIATQTGNALDTLLLGGLTGAMDMVDPSADGSSTSLADRAYQEAQRRYEDGSVMPYMPSKQNMSGDMFTYVNEAPDVFDGAEWLRYPTAIVAGSLTDNIPAFGGVRSAVTKSALHSGTNPFTRALRQMKTAGHRGWTGTFGRSGASRTAEATAAALGTDVGVGAAMMEGAALPVMAYPDKTMNRLAVDPLIEQLMPAVR